LSTYELHLSGVGGLPILKTFIQKQANFANVIHQIYFQIVWAKYFWGELRSQAPTPRGYGPAKGLIQILRLRRTTASWPPEQGN